MKNKEVVSIASSDGIAFPTKKYQVSLNTRPAKETLGKVRVEYLEAGPHGEERISIIREEDDTPYFKILIRELNGMMPESSYPALMKGVIKALGYKEKPKSMFFEQLGKATGIFAIAEAENKGLSFFYSYCLNARRGSIEGTNVLISSGLGLFATIITIESIRIKKV